MINKYNNTDNKDNNTDNIINNNIDNKVYEDNNNKDIKDNEVNPNDSREWVNLDPILMLKIRLKTNPVKICDNESSKHIRYKNSNSYINKQFALRDEVICSINNFIIDPSKWIKDTGSNPANKGALLLSKGFYNMKCENNQTINGYGWRCKQYFNV